MSVPLNTATSISKRDHLIAWLKQNNESVFFALLSFAIFSRVVTDISIGRWAIHAGELFPIRHLPSVPVYSQVFLALEWLLSVVGAAMLFNPKLRRVGAALALIGIGASLTQLFQNQKTLIFLTLAILICANPYKSEPAKKLLQWQLLLMYLFTALSKLNGEFLTGETLRALFAAQIALPLGPIVFKIISWITIGFEFLIPVLLLGRSLIGLALVVFIHLLFGIGLPDVWPFTFVTFALVVLFYSKQKTV